MVLEAAVDPKGCQVAMLQKVIRAEYQRGGFWQQPGTHPLGKMPGNERRAGQCAVAHGAQQYATGPGHRTLTGAQAGGHFTGPHPFEAHGLIFNHQVQQQVLVGTKVPHRHGPPGGQTVGVQGNAQPFGQAFIVQSRDRTLQVALKQTHLLDVVEQTPTNLGRARRCGANQHRLADACLQQLDPLGDGRLRKAQDLGRPFKTGLLYDCGKGRE